MTQGSTANSPVYTGYSAPTVQKFASGSGTYTTPAGVVYINVKLIGGGGGGAGSSTSANNAGAGGTGGNTTFGSTILVGNGGVGGTTGGGQGGAGGTASLSGATGTAATGAQGFGIYFYGTSGTNLYMAGGAGAPAQFGGAGCGGAANSGTQAGTAAQANSGAGGGGASKGGAAADLAGGGGGAGGYAEGIISSPAATYAYAVGAAGSAGTAGTSGSAGGAGGSGYIEVTEYYQLNTYGSALTFTGTGDVVKANSPNITTPNTVGTSTNDNAAAGSVGQLISSVVVQGAPVSLTNNTDANITSISLTAGDWDIQGNISYAPSVAVTAVFGWMSSTSASLPSDELRNNISAALGATAMNVPFVRLSIAATTTFYLSARAQFSSGTCTACGGIYARRAR